MAFTELEIAGERLCPLPEKALFWPREKTLFIADAHFGKVAAFRAAGIPLPPGSTNAALARLNGCIEKTDAQRLVFLGDFLHSKDARARETLERFSQWRNQHAHREMSLVRGNHDAHAGDPPGEWNMRCVDEGETMGPFCLAHHPEPDLLAGHLHPAVLMQGRANDAVRLPCFWFGACVGVLPAFGEFTGTLTVKPKPGDKVFVAVDNVVLDVSAGG